MAFFFERHSKADRRECPTCAYTLSGGSHEVLPNVGHVVVVLGTPHRSCRGFDDLACTVPSAQSLCCRRLNDTSEHEPEDEEPCSQADEAVI